MRGMVCVIDCVCPVLAHTEKTVEWVLTYADYQDQLVDQAALVMTVAGRVSQSGQVLATQHVFRLRTPDLQIQKSSQCLQYAALFSSSLKAVLCDVARHSTITLTETFVPAKSGPRKLIANLDCRQLTQVHGVAEFIVQDE
ncbi:UNVERIFIED_CONTAM: hypothetical protein FKN15_025717 [Acipenser sinensis]